MTELAELLLEKEVIFSEDLERIFGKRKADLIKEEQKKNRIKESVEEYRSCYRKQRVRRITGKRQTGTKR